MNSKELSDRDYRFLKRVAYIYSQVYAPDDIPAIFYSRAGAIRYRVALAGGFWACVHRARGEERTDADRRLKASGRTLGYMAARKAAGLCAICGKRKPKGLGFVNCQKCIDKRKRLS